MIKSNLFPDVQSVISGLNLQLIPSNRKEVLKPFIDFIRMKASNQQEIRINFICTHNSRRSLFSQVWAQTMANYFGIKNVTCFSGGTEETALFPMVAETLRRSGFQISTICKSENPIYTIKFAENEHPIIGFSKKLDNDFNPKSEFLAVMTCDSANEACPIVPGAEKRVSVTYKDPKAYDNSPVQAEKYHESSIQIATEMFYIFSQIKP